MKIWGTHVYRIGNEENFDVQKAMRKVIYVKYQVKDQDLFDKAFGYIRQYY